MHLTQLLSAIQHADSPGPFPWCPEVYRAITSVAEHAPSWTHAVVEIGTDAGLLVFAALFLAAWWRARRDDARGMTLALLTPVAAVVAYIVSETVKTFFDERRPCRTVAEAFVIAPCPPSGDWSFPSNHATVAAACAAALVVVWRRLAPWALSWAALVAFSRVFLGVHYLHDVAAGFILGAVLAPLVMVILARPLTPVVDRLRAWPPLRPVLAADPEGARTETL